MDALAYPFPESRSRNGRRPVPVLVWCNPVPPGVMTPQANENAQFVLAVAARRDRESFRALFLYFAPRVKSYFLHRGMAAQLADELAQETLLVVWRKAERFDPTRGSASTWIFTIARNLRIDQLRRTGKLPDDYRPEEETAASPGDEYCAAERDGRIGQALKGLPADQAEVIRLSFFEEKPHPAIAAELGIPLGTVKSRLRLAMNRLRAALEDLK